MYLYFYYALIASISSSYSKPSNSHKQHHKKTIPAGSNSLYKLSTTHTPTSSQAEVIYSYNLSHLKTEKMVNVTHDPTNEPITLHVGNRTINTNLKTALDDIAPGLNGRLLMSSVTHPSNIYRSYYHDAPTSSVTNSSSVLFEVINIEPFLRGNRRYDARFALLVSIYAAASLGCILITYCVVKTVINKRSRHRQYMLLTKREIDFPLGGGGI